MVVSFPHAQFIEFIRMVHADSDDLEDIKEKLLFAGKGSQGSKLIVFKRCILLA